MKGPALGQPRYPHIAAALAAAAAGEHGVTFVDRHEREERFSWREVHGRALRAADTLLRAGIVAGDRVAIVLDTGPHFLDAFFGTCLAGAVPVVIAPPRRFGSIEEGLRAMARMIARAGARALATNAQGVEMLTPVLDGSLPAGVHDAASLVERGLGDAPPVEPEPDALGFVQFSSGTTVEPKPIGLSHRNVMAQLAIFEAVMPHVSLEPRSIACWLPLNHDMGLFGHLLLSVYCGCPIVMAKPETILAKPSVILRAISRHRVTSMSSPNFFYGFCTRRIQEAELQGVDLSSWRYIMNGAEPVTLPSMRAFGERFRRYGLDPERLMPVYGLAEATLAVTFSPPGRPTRSIAIDGVELARTGEIVPGTFELASVGPPVPGVEVEVRHADGSLLPDRRAGRVWVRSPSVMRGYLGDAEATQRMLVDGWLDTGDLGFIDDGELYLCGRAKDVVIIRGANHLPEEFEGCLESLAAQGVRPGSAIAVGFVPESGSGEELLILAECSNLPPDPGLADAMRTTVLKQTGVRPYGVVLFSRGTLPKTTSGKRRRREALRELLAGEIIPVFSTVPIGPEAEAPVPPSQRQDFMWRRDFP